MKKDNPIQVKGQELIEFAITVTFLLMIVFMIFDLGRGMYYYSVVQNAAREGARFAVVNPNNSSAAVIDRVKQRVIGINPSDPDLIIWLGGSDDISDLDDDWNSDDIVQVRVKFSYKPVTPMANVLLTNGKISMTASSTMQRENW